MSTRIAAMIILICASVAGARGVRISFPDGGTFRPGQLMPVVIEVDEPALRDATIALRADGALPSVAKMAGRGRARAAMLMLSSEAREVCYSVNGAREEKCDVALRDSGNELPQPTEGALGGEDAYAPVLAWHPGASGRSKRMATLSGALLALLFTGCVVLVRRRGLMLGCIIALTGAGACGIEVWRRHIPALWTVESEIIVERADGSTQIDSWRYFTSRTPAPISIELTEQATPVFVDLQQARTLDAKLLCDADSRATLQCTIQPGMKLAIRERRIVQTAGDVGSLRDASSSPMLPLAQRVYANARTRIVGARPIEWTDDQTTHWRAIVLAETK